jgi:hypothetical protein
MKLPGIEPVGAKHRPYQRMAGAGGGGAGQREGYEIAAGDESLAGNGVCKGRDALFQLLAPVIRRKAIATARWNF